MWWAEAFAFTIHWTWSNSSHSECTHHTRPPHSSSMHSFADKKQKRKYFFQFTDDKRKWKSTAGKNLFFSDAQSGVESGKICISFFSFFFEVLVPSHEPARGERRIRVGKKNRRQFFISDRSSSVCFVQIRIQIHFIRLCAYFSDSPYIFKLSRKGKWKISENFSLLVKNGDGWRWYLLVRLWCSLCYFVNTITAFCIIHDETLRRCWMRFKIDFHLVWISFCSHSVQNQCSSDSQPPVGDSPGQGTEV